MTKWVPQFTLVDVQMPGMNGIELAMRLKEVCPDCSVTLFSGQGGTADLLDAARREGHVFEIVSKPIHPTDLLRLASERLGIGSPTLLAP